MSVNPKQTDLNGTRIGNEPTRPGKTGGRRFWRQGDVVISEITDIVNMRVPQRLPPEIRPEILEIRSETGHPHVIHAIVLQKLEPQRLDGIVTSDDPITVTPPQHATLTLPEGTYRVTLAGLPHRIRMFD